jgi:hypothetical protein
MTEIEAKLSKKEEELWRRGQVEIKRLQQEQLQFKDCISQLEDSQASLLTENSKIRGALVEVTSRFEQVVKEMREVLRTLPQQHGGNSGNTSSLTTMQPSPSPSIASTSASEAFCDEFSPDVSYEQATTAGSTEKGVMPATPCTGTGPLSQQNGTFCTPPRSEMPTMQDPGLAMVPPFIPSTSMTHTSAASAAIAASPTGTSPAVLSLASALTAATAGYASPAGPGLQLQLAECLEQSSQLHIASSMSPSLATPPPAGLVGVTPQYTTPTHGILKVQLQKEPGFETLGMEVNEDGAAIRVTKIDEHGLVGRYNRTQSCESSMVRVGDMIVEVNGISGDPSGMLQECKSQQIILFSIPRPTSPAASSAPSPLHPANAPNGAFTGCSDNSDVDRVLAEVTSKVAAIPPSWGRLRAEAAVFVPSSQASENKSFAESLDTEAQIGKASSVAEACTETSLVAPAAVGSVEADSAPMLAEGNEEKEGTLTRLLFP